MQARMIVKMVDSLIFIRIFLLSQKYLNFTFENIIIKIWLYGK